MRSSILLALLSGALYVFSFAPWDIYPLMWIAFTPLLIAAEKNRTAPGGLRTTLLSGFIVSLIIAWGGFYWIIHASQQYGGLPWWAAFLLMVAFSVTGQLQIPIYLWIREKLLAHARFRNRPLLSIVFLGILYGGIESLYPKLFLDTAGNAFYNDPLARQLADIGGPFTITVAVIWVNELFARLWFARKKPILVATASLLVAIHAYGYYRIQQYRGLEKAAEGSPQYKIALIQANIGDFLKVAAERGAFDASHEVMFRYISMSRKAISAFLKPDGVVWPETAYPAIYGRPMSSVESNMDHMMSQFLASTQADVMFGGYDSDDSGLEYNSIFFLSPKQKLRSVYHKNFLLMFGETLPFYETFPTMKSWFPNMGFFGRGPGPTIQEIRNIGGDRFHVAPSICYEALFPEYSMAGALLGADALLNVTNDSWFGEHGEPYLHLALTQFRSVETRLPLIRATNTGFSVILNPLGETLAKSKLFTPEIISGAFGKRIMPESPYMAMARVFGVSWFTRLLQIVSLFLGLYLLVDFKKLKKLTTSSSRKS